MHRILSRHKHTILNILSSMKRFSTSRCVTVLGSFPRHSYFASMCHFIHFFQVSSSGNSWSGAKKTEERTNQTCDKLSFMPLYNYIICWPETILEYISTPSSFSSNFVSFAAQIAQSSNLLTKSIYIAQWILTNTPQEIW